MVELENAMYLIVWKYQISKENQTEFEFEYGKEGTWSNLFRNSEGYVSSDLIKSSEVDLTYLLIDNWTTKQSYEDFKKENIGIYDKLSSEFERLYESEEKIGEFSSIN